MFSVIIVLLDKKIPRLSGAEFHDFFSECYDSIAGRSTVIFAVDGPNPIGSCKSLSKEIAWSLSH